MTCDRCFRALSDGDHGEGVCPYEPRSRSTAIVADDIPGGMVVENGFPEPVRVFSHSEHRRLLAARGLEINAKWAGPNDKHLSRMDIPCAATLESAAILLSRKKSTPFAPEDAYEPIPITVTPITFAKER